MSELLHCVELDGGREGRDGGASEMIGPGQSRRPARSQSPRGDASEVQRVGPSLCPPPSLTCCACALDSARHAQSTATRSRRCRPPLAAPCTPHLGTPRLPTRPPRSRLALAALSGAHPRPLGPALTHDSPLSHPHTHRPAHASPTATTSRSPPNSLTRSAASTTTSASRSPKSATSAAPTACPNRASPCSQRTPS